MAKILILAASGFGKSTSIGKNESLGIEGLDPDITFVISVVNRPLPFKNSNNIYPITEGKTPDFYTKGKRLITNNAALVAAVLNRLALPECPIKNVVLDDANYIMQDYFMKNALVGGWDTPKQIGADMFKIFEALDKFNSKEKNIFILAHYEEQALPGGRNQIKMKTTGNMTREFITPEGRVDILLLGQSKWNDSENKVIKQYVTNENEYYAGPKSPPGMFEELFIPNDLGYVNRKVREYYG